MNLVEVSCIYMREEKRRHSSPNALAISLSGWGGYNVSHTLVYTAISSAGPRLAGISLRPTTGKAFFHDCAHTAGLSWPSREHGPTEGRKELPQTSAQYFQIFRSQRKETPPPPWPPTHANALRARRGWVELSAVIYKHWRCVLMDPRRVWTWWHVDIKEGKFAFRPRTFIFFSSTNFLLGASDEWQFWLARQSRFLFNRKKNLVSPLNLFMGPPGSLGLLCWLAPPAVSFWTILCLMAIWHGFHSSRSLHCFRLGSRWTMPRFSNEPPGKEKRFLRKQEVGGKKESA